jgi:hypothetical protein
LSRTQSGQKGNVDGDVEKAPESETSDEELFDLETTLRGNKGLEEEAGIKSKRIGVVWENLTVSGIGGVKNYVKVRRHCQHSRMKFPSLTHSKTFPMAFVSFFNVYETAMHLLGFGKKGREFDILKNFRGVTKPGEMVLVLGRPGSGCTTFLKVISNQRYGYTKIGG